jgi:polyphenol oxidase
MEPFKTHTMIQQTCFDIHPRVIAGLTTRKSGYSEAPFDTLNMGLHVSDEKDAVIRNRQELAQELNIRLEKWIIGEQVHGTEVKNVDHKSAGAGAHSMSTAIAGVDGLITNKKNLVLGAFFADCVPLYFYDPTTNWIGIAHAGWKGTVNGMGVKMIEALRKNGCQFEDLEVIIGPSISKAHYEVDQKVVDYIPQQYKNECVIDHQNGKYQLNLKALHRRMMIDTGIPAENIQVSGACTYEEDELYYSHRRDRGKTGRMLGFIALRS